MSSIMTGLRHFDNLGTARFVTFSCYRRLPSLEYPGVKQIVIEELDRARDKHGFQILGYVLMPEHVHLVLYPPSGMKLGLVIGEIKSRSAKRFFSSRMVVVPHSSTVGEPPEQTVPRVFWHKRCYDHNCRTPQTVWEKIHYCHNNPGELLMKTPSPRFFLFLCFTFYLAGCAQSPVDRLRAYQDAVNLRQVDKVLSFYSDGAVFQLAPGLILHGKAELRGLTQYDSVMNTRLTFTNFSVQGDTVFCQVDEASEWFKGVDIPVIHHRGAFVVKDGLINYVRADITSESHEAIHRAFYTLVGWASGERPEELARLMPGGRYHYTAQTAVGWLELIKEWKGATRGG